MTESFAVGDLVEAVKGEQCHSGRIEARMDDLLCIGSDGYRLDYYTRKGFTLTVIEKALPPLPTLPGIYVSWINMPSPTVVHKITDGRWVDADDQHYLREPDVAQLMPLTRLAPVVEVLAVFAEKANWIPTAAAIQDTAKHFGVTV